MTIIHNCFCVQVVVFFHMTLFPMFFSARCLRSSKNLWKAENGGNEDEWNHFIYITFNSLKLLNVHLSISSLVCQSVSNTVTVFVKVIENGLFFIKFMFKSKRLDHYHIMILSSHPIIPSHNRATRITHCFSK